jgi:hypothetical protein
MVFRSASDSYYSYSYFFSCWYRKYEFWLFSTYTFAGTLVWSSVLVGAGYLLGDNWGSIAGCFLSTKKFFDSFKCDNFVVRQLEVYEIY